MIRLRQVALVADDLEATVDRLCQELGLTVCFRDPGVAEFGLANALMTVGDQFLEVVSPMQERTTAGRLLTKRLGERSGRITGYMVIHEVDDLDGRMTTIADRDVRVAWSIDLPDIRARHLHPADVGGAIVSVDQPVPNGSWRWAGPVWRGHHDNGVVTAIAGVRIGALDAHEMAGRWRDLGIDHAVSFHDAGAAGEGLDELHLVAADRDRAGTSLEFDQLLVRLV